MRSNKQHDIAEVFVAKLIDRYQTSGITDGMRKAYVSALTKCDLSQDEFDKVLDIIQTSEPKWPSIASIWEVMKQVKTLRKGVTRNKAVLLFDLDGYQTCIYFTWPDEPKIPDRATNARVRILDAVNNILAELPTKEERRAIFRKNFIAEGGKPELADKWFEEIDRQSRTQLADYDDRLTDDEL